jgi:RNA polymerase subunit RPABC4/transcription elongation factor Spt4
LEATGKETKTIREKEEMSLIECKECKKEISKKATKCPHCGAPAKKKTSIFTWLVLVIIVYIVYLAGKSPSPTSPVSSKEKSPSQTKTDTEQAPENNTPWTLTSDKDEMTGESSEYMISDSVYPIRKMDFPYHNVNASLVVACDSKREWAYFAFNTSPNLANDETQDGYNLINTRIKWGEQLQDAILTQRWNSKFIQFQDSKAAINNIMKYNIARLELQWHGEKPAHFDFSLKDSSASIQKLRNKCSSY